MAFNGSGVFTLVSGNPVVTGTTISSTWANNTLSDIATGLSTTITKDGQTTPTANIPMGGFKITGLGAATLNGDAVRYQDVGSFQQSQTFTAFTTGGTATAYTLTPIPAITSLVANQRFRVKFNAANTTTTPTLAISGLAATAIKVYDSAGVKQSPEPGALALNMLADVEYDGTDYVVLNQLPPPIPKTYLSGLILSNNASDPTNDIDIASGVATDSTNAYLLSLTGPFTKRLDAAWAAGSGNGGLDTGSIANTTYHVWLIRKDSDGSVDALFSTSATAPTMPAGYTYKANIGAIIRVAGAILLFTQVGNEVLWKSSALDFDSGANTTASTIAVRAPLGIQTDASVQVIYNNTVSGNFVLYVTSPDQNDETASLAAARVTVINPSTSVFGHATVSVRTNTSAQIRIRSDDSNNTTRISTRGFSYIRR